MTDKAIMILMLGVTCSTLLALLFSFTLVMIDLRHKRKVIKQLKISLLEKAAIATRLEERELLLDEFKMEVQDNFWQLVLMQHKYLRVSNKFPVTEKQHEIIKGAINCNDAMLVSIQEINYRMDTSLVTQKGLFNAIGWQVDQIRSSHAIDIRLESPGMDMPLNAQQSLVVYRIAQEAISNTLNHSGASELVIRLHYTDREFTMDVTDDGKGFDPAITKSGKVGIRNMEHRARILGGKLEVKSWLDSGTTIRLVVPLGNNTDEDILRTPVHHE